MKVRITMETLDAEGNKTQSQVSALMAMKDHAMQLTYVEDLSGEGRKTKSSMRLTPGQLRVIRTGEINTDFMYGNCMTHNTSYGTMYGTFPMTIQTEKFLYSSDGVDLDDMQVTSDFFVQVHIHYDLLMADGDPMKMKMSMKIVKA